MTVNVTPRPAVLLHGLIIGVMLLALAPRPSGAQSPPTARKRSSQEWRQVKERDARPLRPSTIAVRFWEQGKLALSRDTAPIATQPPPTGPGGTGPGPTPGVTPTPGGGLPPGGTPPASTGLPMPKDGRIGGVRVEGNRHYSTAFIQRQFAPAVKGSTFNLEGFQRQLLMLNEFPGLEVKAFLVPDPKTGKYDVVLKVKDDNALAGSVEYNNFGNPYVGENRVGLTVAKGNLTGRGDILAVRASAGFPARESVPYLQGQYTTPVNNDGAKVGVTFANGAFVAGSDLALLDVRGRATVYGVTGSMNLRRALTDTSDLTFGLYHKSSYNSTVGLTTSHDEIREFMAVYSTSWRTTSTANFLNLSATAGLGTLLGGMPNGDPYASRAGAGNSFLRMNGDYGGILKLGGPYLVVRGSGQWASGPLLVPEQFAVGGPDSVRGYQQAQFLGDAGYSASAELRLPLGRKDSDFQAGLFVDHGRIWLMQPLPGERASVSLTGVGVGLRAKLWGQTYGRADVGFPLERISGPSRNGAVIYGQITTRF